MSTAPYQPPGQREAFPSLYCALWPDLKAKAQGMGYALLIHGSLARDLDLVAVPWTEQAAEASALVDALLGVCHGWLGGEGTRAAAVAKPHGRTSYVLMLGGHAYVDLGVMPRTSVPST